MHRWPLVSLTMILGLMVFGVSIGVAEETLDPRALYSRGLSALASDDPYRAVDSFRVALRINPSYVDARLGMAEALFLLGEYEEALREIEEARPFAYNHQGLILLEARILTALGRYEEASNLYEGILLDRPNDGDANRGLAEIYAILGQRELADEAFTRSLRYSPGDMRVLLQLVLLHDEALERREAESVLSEALRRFPDSLSVRIQAAEHYALYQDWDKARDHLERAKSIVDGPDDLRYRRIGLLDAALLMRMGQPERALEVLHVLNDWDSPEVLYMMAKANRMLGDEERTQQALKHLLRMRPDDEIARIFLEEYFVGTIGGMDDDRRDAAEWHLEKGQRYEDSFYYDRALFEYRRGRLIDGANVDTWLTYADLIRKKGFPDKYRDELHAALGELTVETPESARVGRRLELFEHSEADKIGNDWGISDSWNIERTSWNFYVFVTPTDHALPIHNGAEQSLARFFADILDSSSYVSVVNPGGGLRSDVAVVDDFAQAFRRSRDSVDFFVMVRFNETERSFGAQAEVYLARTGELLGRFGELRTGRDRTVDTLKFLAESLVSAVPGKLRILQTDGNRVLLDKGRWHGLSGDEELIVLRRGGGRPALVEGGISYESSDYLGTVELTLVSESLSEGRFERKGDFDFISPGDEVFFLSEPESSDEFSAPDPAFRRRLLSVP